MRLTMRQVLSVPPLNDAVVLAGERGLDREVRGVSVVDTPDVARWVKGYEFMLTAGFAVKDNPEELEAIVRALNDRNVTALGIKVGRFLAEIPEAVLKVADEMEFPLIGIPAYCSWLDIMNPVFEEILKRKAYASTIEGRRSLVEDILLKRISTTEEIMRKAFIVGVDLSKGGTFIALTRLGPSNGKGSGYPLYNALINVLGEGHSSSIAIAPYEEWLGVLGIGIKPREALDEGERFLRVLKPILPESEALVVGIGGNRGEPACLRESFLEACKAAVSGPLAIGGKPPYLYKDLGVYRLLVDPISAREKISFCNDLIGPLIQHDLSYDTKLCQTLEVFLDTGSMRKAADALSIHYNTIKYRLSQIRRLLGTDLSDGKSRLAMHLALKVWALEKNLPTRSGD